MEITYDDMTSSNPIFDIVSVVKADRPVSPGLFLHLMQITGMDGAYYFGADRHVKTIGFEIIVKSDSAYNKRKAFRAISSWITPEDRKLKPLIFSDESDVRDMAIGAAKEMPDRFLTPFMSKIEIAFIVPTGYSESISTKTIDTFPGQNEGTAPCPCVIRVKMNEISSTLKITLDETGEFILLENDPIRWDNTLQVDNEVEINTLTRMITVDSVDARAGVTFNSDYFELPVGEFTLTVDENADIEVEFRELFK